MNLLSPITVLGKLVVQVASQPLHTSTPGELSNLDTPLLKSSPPDGTEFRHANAWFNAQGQVATSLSSPAKHYAKRMIHAFETTQSELVAIQNELAEHQRLPRSWKYHRKGKHAKLKGWFV